MAINLIFGFVATGINNAAHIGGMIIGAFLALMWYLSYVSKLKTILKILGLLGAVIITGGFICTVYKSTLDYFHYGMKSSSRTLTLFLKLQLV